MSTKVSFHLLPVTLGVNVLPPEVDLGGKLTCCTDQLKDIIQDLYELMVQTTSYGNVGQGVSSKDVLQNTLLVARPLSQHAPFHPTQNPANTLQCPSPRIADPTPCLRLVTIRNTYPRPTRADSVRRRRSQPRHLYPRVRGASTAGKPVDEREEAGIWQFQRHSSEGNGKCVA